MILWVLLLGMILVPTAVQAQVEVEKSTEIITISGKQFYMHHVKKGQTLFLIEAMKTFNAVRAPRAGVVKQILVKDSQPVEYDEPLLILE